MPKTIAFVPVRGGSKGIPRKNIKLFCGKPLIYWVLNELNKTKKVDEIILATDSDEIKNVVEAFGMAKVKVYWRNPLNATDVASTESVILEYLSKTKLNDSDIFILVQATSPFTQTIDIENALNQIYKTKADSLLSCALLKRFFWSEDGIAKNYDINNRPRRQDFKGELVENGAFYINTVGNIKKYSNRLSGKICIYEMPEYTSVEIDEEEDWIIAEKIMHKYILIKNDFHNIKLFLTDVDGVLTDAGMYYSENGDELKKFNTRDGKGFELLREARIKTGIITSEDTQIVKRRAKKLKVDYMYQGATNNKLEIAQDICQTESISLDEVAFIGDDINDLELLKQVGLAACPSDAVKAVKNTINIAILNSKGGEGVVREFVEKYITK